MRIVSLSPSSTEVLFAIGAGNEVVAVTHLCDYPLEAQRRERLGSWLHTQPDRLAQLKPDLTVTTTFLPPELKANLDVGELLHLQPRGLGGVFESIIQLGEATGRTQTARELVQNMHRQLETLRASAPAHRLTVYCEEWPDPPMIAGNWVPELVELAGAMPVGGVHVNPSTAVNLDALRAADPDVMVFHWCSAAQAEADVDRVRQRQAWQDFRAVKTNALVPIPNSLLNRPGPRLVDGARALQAAFQRYQRLR